MRLPASAEERAQEIDRLRSLPYMGWTETEATVESGVKVIDANNTWPGYNLYVNRDVCEAVLIDGLGRVVNTWAHGEGGRSWSHVELLPNGDLLVAGRVNTHKHPAWRPGDGQCILKYGWDGHKILEKRIDVHHDLEVLSDNRLLVLLARMRDLPEFRRGARVVDTSIAILSDKADLIEETSLYDLFMANPERLPVQHVGTRIVAGEPMVDLFHANSVEWLKPSPEVRERDALYGGKKVMVCVRQQDTVIIVDWETKELVWHWGRGELASPHCATLLDNGNILIFDNGLGRQYSRVVEVDPLSRAIVWEYKKPNPSDFYSAYRGGNQRFPNGNTLIANSEAGEAFEVTQDGRIVWEFRNPRVNKGNRRATIVRMDRLPVDYVNAIIRSRRP